MASPRELDRLASMAAVLRPDWPVRSVRSVLARPELARRPFADIAVALAVVATDPRSETPARVLQHGPWWAAAYLASAEPPSSAPVGPECHRHPGHAAGRCGQCTAEATPSPGLRELLTALDVPAGAA